MGKNEARSDALTPAHTLTRESTAQLRFEALLATHARLLLKVAHTYCAHAEERRDLLQEMSAQLWRAFPTYDEARPFTTWMYRIALNVAISHVRRAAPRERHTAPLDAQVLERVPALPAEEPDERVRTLRAFMERLEPLQRALLLLYLEERSYREIAEVLGITETNVATKLSRLKQRLREALSAQGAGAEGGRNGSR